MTTTPNEQLAEIDRDWLEVTGREPLQPLVVPAPTFHVTIKVDAEGVSLADVEEEAWRQVSHFDGRAADESSLRSDWEIDLRVHPLTQDHRLYRGVGTARLVMP